MNHTDPTASAPGDRPRNAAIVLFSAIVPLALLVAPLVTTQLMAERGLGTTQVGAYFLFELGGISLASLPALLWLARVPSQRVARVAALVFVLGNAASVAPLPLGALLAVRLLTALAGGSLMLLCMAAAGISPNRDRLFGYWLSGQLVLGAAALALLPAVFARVGLGGLYGLMAVLMLAALPLTRALEGIGAARASDGDSAGAPRSLTLVVMLAVLAFYAGIGGTWAFMSVVAERGGLPAGTVSAQLAAASLLGIVGAAVATWCAGRVSRHACLLFGYACLLASVTALLWPQRAMGFAAAAYAFKFGWTFALPFLLATIAARDPSGRIMGPVNLVIGSGTSIGPLIAGSIIASVGLKAMLATSLGFVLISLGLIWMVATTRGPRATQVAQQDSQPA